MSDDKNSEIAASAQETLSPPEGTNEGATKRPANWSLRILLVLLVFLAGAGTGISFLPRLQEHIPLLKDWLGAANNPSQPDLILTQRVSALENWLNRQEGEMQALKSARNAPVKSDPQLLARIEKLEQAGAEAKPRELDMSQSARIDILLGRMGQLEASFVPLSKGLSDAQEARQERASLSEKSTAHEWKLDQIEERLARVEKYTARDNNGALLAYRIGALRQKALSGAAFGTEIAAVKKMLEQGSFATSQRLGEAIRWLSEHANGIASEHQITDQFDDLIPELIRARSAHKDDPWWKRTYDSAKNLIMVRKTDKDNADDLDALITDAQKMLDRFDLAETLALLKNLPENIRSILDIWILRAQIYLRAQQELDQIEQLTAVNALMPGKSAPKRAPVSPDKEEISS